MALLGTEEFGGNNQRAGVAWGALGSGTERRKLLLHTSPSEELKPPTSTLFLYLGCVYERGVVMERQRHRERRGERREKPKEKHKGSHFLWKLHRFMTLQAASADGV